MKVFILREEDLYARCECGEGECGQHDGRDAYDIIGVYSTREKAQAIIDEYEKEDKKNKKSYRSTRYFDIEEMELDK